MICREHIRAARALIGWTQADLADQAGVAEITVRKIEAGATDARGSTLEALQVAFTKAGVALLEDGDIRPGGIGVRLTRLQGTA